jgi:hypothetical protein
MSEALSTLLVERPEQVRLIALGQLSAAAKRLHEQIDEAIRYRRLNAHNARHLLRRAEELMPEIRACEELLAQVGWRPPKGKR